MRRVDIRRPRGMYIFAASEFASRSALRRTRTSAFPSCAPGPTSPVYDEGPSRSLRWIASSTAAGASSSNVSTPGRRKSSSSTVRGWLERFHASCSEVSSNTRHSPSCHGRNAGSMRRPNATSPRRRCTRRRRSRPSRRRRCRAGTRSTRRRATDRPIAVGTALITWGRAAPRTDPSVQNYRTRLLPRVRSSKRFQGYG